MAHIIDLSHTISHGLETYKGLPAVHVCDFLSREESKSLYEEGTSFQIDQINMCGNSGTYIDSPFHRYIGGDDLSDLALEKTVNLPATVIRAPSLGDWMAIGAEAFEGHMIKGMAVLIDTGWCKNFGSPIYQKNHPFLTEEAAIMLRDKGAKLVGIDSHNIDDIRAKTRPCHSVLLGAGIPIVEHMTNLSSLPDLGAYFFAAPIKFQGVGTFPTRAYALLNEPK